jgi:UDP-glucose 4-epimerase
VTGADGFVGSHLVQALQKAGAKVEAFNGDILSASPQQGFDYIFHLAAITDLKLARKNPSRVFEVNVLGTLKILENLEGAPKFIYVSTLGVYGEPKSVPVREDSPTRPIEPYAASKLAGEAIVEGFCRQHGTPFAIARLFNVYGKGQRRDFVIPALVEEITSKDKVVVKNPDSTRDFIYIDDVIAGLLAVAAKGKNDIYNIGTGKETSIKMVAETIMRFTNRDVSFILQRDRDVRVKRSRADIKKAKKELGWSAKVTFKEGIQKLLA